jgi:hypothetical protein
MWRTEHPDRCELVLGDASAYLRAYPFVGDELVYADPPYLPTTRRRAVVYRCDYEPEDHVELLEVLMGLPCMVMVSGYESALYARMLAGWHCVEFKAMTHRGPRLEAVWMNFPLPPVLHDARYLGVTFRDRQNLRRKHDRLLRKFEAMQEPERNQMLSILRTRFDSEATE